MGVAVATWLPQHIISREEPLCCAAKAFISSEYLLRSKSIGLHGRIKRRRRPRRTSVIVPPPHCPALALRIPRAARSSRALRVRRALLPRVEDCERLRNTRRSIAERRRRRHVRYSVVRRLQSAFSTIGLAFRRAMMASSSSGSPVVPSKVATSSTSSSFSSSASISFTG